MIVLGVDPPPDTNSNAEEHRSQLARYTRAAGGALEGAYRVVAAGSATTTASAASTVVDAAGAKSGDRVFFFPADSTAAAMVATVYASVTADDQITLNHVSQPATGTFDFMVVTA